MKKSLASLLLIAGFTGGVAAQTLTFEDVDLNQDGLITEDEAGMVEGLDFSTTDTNGDGGIDHAEWDAAGYGQNDGTDG